MVLQSVSARLEKAVYAYNSELFLRLAQLVDDCSYSQETGCLHCPHLVKCRWWWDHSVCEHATPYRANPREFDTFFERFEQIRNGHYKGANKNGGNGQK